jgi:NADH dehydrogenase
VVVIGAGFGGIATVRALRDAPLEVTLVDQNNYHLFQPLLYQVGTALLDPSEIAYPVRAIVRRLRNCDFLLGRVISIDLDQHTLHTTAGDLPYDRLVVAAGAVTDSFGKPGVLTHAFGLKNLGDAITLRNHLLTTVEHAAATKDPTERRRLLTVAVAGGGATGVECAGAVCELVGLVLRRDFPHLDLSAFSVLLIEAGSSVLTQFAPSLQRHAIRALERKGIKLRFGAKVDDVTEQGVVLQGGEHIPAATVIWAVGVRGSDAGGLLAPQRARLGRIPVDAGMRIPDHPEVFVIGDLAAATVDGKPLPMLGAVAQQQGAHVAATITAEAGAGSPPPPFRYHDRGTMATIGRNAAVAQIGPIRAWGFPGWVIWLAVHLVLLISFRNRVVVLINWARDYLFYDRPVRLITAPTPHAGDNGSPHGDPAHPD